MEDYPSTKTRQEYLACKIKEAIGELDDQKARMQKHLGLDSLLIEDVDSKKLAELTGTWIWLKYTTRGFLAAKQVISVSENVHGLISDYRREFQNSGLDDMTPEALDKQLESLASTHRLSAYIMYGEEAFLRTNTERIDAQ